jgi:hypothetical protein
MPRKQKNEKSPLLGLFQRGTLCELTDAGKLPRPPDLHGDRFIVSGVTADGMIACTREGSHWAYTLPPRNLRPIRAAGSPHLAEDTAVPKPGAD